MLHAKLANLPIPCLQKKTDCFSCNVKLVDLKELSVQLKPDFKLKHKNVQQSEQQPNRFYIFLDDYVFYQIYIIIKQEEVISCHYMLC